MKAVILAGGTGTRLSEETTARPKPMVEIGGRPILWHIMKIYSAHGIHDFVICCGYKGYLIKEYFANYFLHMSDVTFDIERNRMEVHNRYAEPWRVTLVDTGEETMTGGRLKRVASFVKDEEAFCFTYGDGVGDINITELIAFHRAQNVKATVTAVIPPGRFGALNLVGSKVQIFQEKPEGDGAMINGGFFVLSPAAIDYIEHDATFWEREPLENLAQQGQLAAYHHHGFWQPMDTLRDKNHLEEALGVRKGAVEGVGVSHRLNPEFWRGKRVFLTGHTGFKGGWLSLWLQQMGANVIGYALAPPTNPCLFEIARVSEGMHSIIADIRDLSTLSAAIAEHRPEIVFHMAAQPLVRLSYEQPVETYATNVMGTVHVLEAIRLTGGVRAVVNITTDKCYENREWIWGYRESEAMGGYDPYSNSKGCAELVTAAYRASFFNPADHAKHGVALASARAGNVIGGGDWAKDRLIPDIMAAFLEQRRVVIRNPQAVRPWQYVLEPLRGYLMLAERLWNEGPAFAESWNFGPNDEDAKPVEWIVKGLAGRWGNGATWSIGGGSKHPHEANYLKLDISKARSKLDWHPRWNLETSLQRIADWYLAYQRRDNMRDLTLKQIAQYETVSSPN